MCGKASPPPEPKAPPPPATQRDQAIDATRNRQQAAARASTSGYESTLLTGPGGDASPGNVTSPVLGG